MAATNIDFTLLRLRHFDEMLTNVVENVLKGKESRSYRGYTKSIV
jgi:hypothetical protein